MIVSESPELHDEAVKEAESVETAAATEDRGPLSSPELLRQAVLSPEVLAGLEGRPAGKAARFGRLLHTARAELDDGATTEEVLWTLWSGTRWPARLRAMVDEGGAGARMAHRDLDALCALFDVAARTEEQRAHKGVVNFLATLTAQQIPADSLAEQGVRGDAVRLLTAHRSLLAIHRSLPYVLPCAVRPRCRRKF